MNCRLSMLVSLLVLPLIGCASDKTMTYQNPALGRARPVVVRSVEAMGGLERLTTVEYSANATVVMQGLGRPQATTAPAAPAPAISQVRMRIDVGEQTISGWSPTGTGWWQASQRQGKCEFVNGENSVSPAQRQAICEMLRTVLHRVTGPMNIFINNEKVRSRATRTRVDGIEVYRVAVSDGKAEAKAYYYEVETGLLKFVTTGADTPNQKGFITIYQWQTLPGGVAFPQSIRVVRLGQHVLVGLERVLEVDFSDVRIVR